MKLHLQRGLQMLASFSVLFLFFSPHATFAAEPSVTITSTIVGHSQLELGITHTQQSLLADPTTRAAAIPRLTAAVTYHNQHLMGWGALNPEPAPGQFRWASLDARIAQIRAVPGAVPVLTLCCAPDWMKGGASGQTDWSRLEVAPRPEHYADFAHLAALAAQRYRDVRYFQVWNEFKGFWDASANNWNYRAYTELYNQVYRAIKAVRPDAQVGGFYMVIEGTGANPQGDWASRMPITSRQAEALDYWLVHKAGADFICLDKAVRSYHDTHTYSRDELMALTSIFATVAQQVRERTNLPIWWSEFYLTGERADGSVAAAQAAILAQMLRGGSRVALSWQEPRLASALFDAAGVPLPTYEPTRLIHQWFPPGTPLYQVNTSDAQLVVLAGRSKTLLINLAGGSRTVRVNGIGVALGAYAVTLIDTPASASAQGASITLVDDQARGTGPNQLDYQGSGWHDCLDCGAELYKGSTRWSRTRGDSVRIRFSGSQIALISPTDAHHGIGEVSIDGGPRTPVDFYSPTRVGQVRVWTSPPLASGPHTLLLRVTGTRRTQSSDTVVPTDAVAITAEP
jgi:hypothetical protein